MSWESTAPKTIEVTCVDRRRWKKSAPSLLKIYPAGIGEIGGERIALFIRAMHLENSLCQINTNCRNPHGDAPLGLSGTPLKVIN